MVCPVSGSSVTLTASSKSLASTGSMVTTVSPVGVRSFAGRSLPGIPQTIDPDTAARAVCDGLERERGEIIDGSSTAAARLVDFLESKNLI